MPLNTRQDLFNRAFDDRQQFAEKDILCFQEFSLTNLKLQKKPGYQEIRNDKNTLCTLFNTKKFRYTWHKSGTFNIHGVDATKGYLALILLTQDPTPKIIIIVNIHLQGGVPKEVAEAAKKAGKTSDQTYRDFRTDQLTDFLKQSNSFFAIARPSIEEIAKNYDQQPIMIVCGDFNSPAQNQELYDSIQKLFIERGLTDAESRMGKNRPSTEYADQSLDYIFYSKNLHLDSISYYPQQPKKDLLTHAKENDAEKKYFSDHTELHAQFSFKKPVSQPEQKRITAGGGTPTPAPTISQAERKRMTAGGGAPAPTMARPKSDPAWAPADQNIQDIWNRLQTIMEAHNDAIVPADKASIWELWNQQEWDAREEITGDTAPIWLLDEKLGEFIRQYLIDYETTKDRPAFVASVGAVVPSLYGHGKPRSKDELDVNIDVISSVAPSTGKMLRDLFIQRFGKK